MRIQTALEFLFTYSWALLILFIFLAAVTIIVTFPGRGGAAYSPSYCYIEPSLPCSAAAVVSNSTGSYFILVFQNNLGTAISFTANSLLVSPQLYSNNSYAGGCLPTIARPGAQVICNASLDGYKPATGAQLSPRFSLSYHICTNICTAQVYNTSGTGSTIATPASSAIFRVELATSTLTGNIILNGISYPSNVVVQLVSGVSYSVYAKLPPSYIFNGWTTTNGVQVKNNVQSTTVTTNSIGLLQVNFFPSTTSSTSTSTTSTSSTSTTSTSTTSTSTTSTTTSSTTSTIMYVYCEDAGNSASMYYAPVYSPAVGAWISTTAYPNYPADKAGCVTYNGYMYCSGGYPAGTPSYYAAISSAGIGAWTSTTAYPISYIGGGTEGVGGYFFGVAGNTGPTTDTNLVYAAPLSSSGIGSWSSTASYPLQSYGMGCAYSSGYAYCTTGSTISNSVGLSNSYYASISGGSVGSWASTTSYPLAQWGMSCAASGGYMYCVGGAFGSAYNAITTAYYAPVTGSGIGTWTSTTPYPDVVIGNYCTTFNSNIYCFGGDFNGGQVYYAPVSGSGIGTWVATNSFPITLSDNACVLYQ